MDREAYRRADDGARARRVLRNQVPDAETAPNFLLEAGADPIDATAAAAMRRDVVKLVAPVAAGWRRTWLAGGAP